MASTMKLWQLEESWFEALKVLCGSVIELRLKTSAIQVVAESGNFVKYNAA